MLRILVIDDEPRQRKGLEEIIHRFRQEDEICAFNNGERALEYARQHRVDIVFSDIRMPGMTGLDMAKQLLVICPNVVVILVSVYADFAYAQKAMELGAFGYILKPVSVNELQEVLERAVKKAESKLQEKLLGHDRMALSALTVYQQHLFRQWLCGEINENEKRELETFLPEWKWGYIACIGFAEMQEETDRTETMENTINWLKQYLSPAEVYCLHGESSEKIMMAIILINDGKIDFQMSLERFWRSIQREYEESISVFVSCKFDSQTMSIQNAFEEVKEVSNILFYGPCEKVVYSEDWPQQVDELSIGAIVAKMALVEGVKEEDSIKAIEALKNLFEVCGENSVLRPHILKEIVVHTYLQVLDGIHDFLQEEEKRRLTEKSLHLKERTSYDQLRKDAKELLWEIMEFQAIGKRSLSPVQQAICYIKEHYQEDIGLNMLSEKYHYSPSYFSAIFKTETGENLISYVNRIRLEKALDYMTVSSLKNHEIAAKVGVKDCKYFNRIFKKKYGMSVQEYRRKHKKS